MAVNTVVLLHGFASSGKSRKAQVLGEKFQAFPGVQFHAFEFSPTPRDFEYMTVTGMINRLRQYVLDRSLERVFIVGSSMGALVGLRYAHYFVGVSQMLLLAPALAYLGHDEESSVFHFGFGREIPLNEGFSIDGAQYARPIAPPCPVTIVHGLHDDVVPIENSRRYAARYPQKVTLIEVDSDHRLNDQLDVVWERLKILAEL